jgi:hypothetical protein
MTLAPLCLRLLGVQLAIVLALGCSAVPPHPKIGSIEQGFSSRLARAHLVSLDGLYPRFPGSRDDTIVRSYLMREFHRVGAKTAESAEGDRRHLIAELKGVSKDVILLVAPYPALESRVWIDDSSAVLLLEFARVFGADRLPYTLRFALAETRPIRIIPTGITPSADPTWKALVSAGAARRRVSEAGRSLARAIEAEGGTGRIRAVITFDTSVRSGRPIARDLRSHPEFRKVFWQSASELGFDSTFPPESDWASPESLHLGFRERSMDRVLALVDETRTSADPIPTATLAEFSPGSFESIGAVTAEALLRLMRRFQKVDAFSR